MKHRLAAVLLVAGLPTVCASAQDPTAAPTPPAGHVADPSSGLTAGHDGHFFLQSADGRNRLQLGALFQAQARAFQADRGRDTEFLLERMRLEISGKVNEVYRFNFEPNFTEDEIELEEAWFGGVLPGGAELILGRMKEPFGLEEMLPRAPQDWVNFSILNQFSPAEDHGITLLGSFCDELDYGLAVYNGSGGDETNSDKDVAARIVWRPFAGEDCCLQGLQFGAAGTFGRADAMLTGKSLRNEAKQDFLRFSPGTRMDGDRWRAGLEAGWYNGPFAVLAEALLLQQEMVASAGRDDVTLDGGYVGFSWVLTGEDKTWRGVEPAQPFGAGTSGYGAWQFATRISRLSLDPALMAIGAVGSTGFTDTVTTIDAGLNWYMTKLAMMRMHVLWTDYDEPIGIGGTTFGDELSVLIQAQFKF